MNHQTPITVSSKTSLSGFLRSVTLLLTATLIPACGPVLEDPRDKCCTQTTLEYRYVRYSQDEYKTFVDEMRHFLFSADGSFIVELPQSEQTPQTLTLNRVPVGKYTVLTVGNSAGSGKTRLPDLVPGTLLSDVILELTREGDEPNPRSDELFWNSMEVEVVEGQSNHYICDLANIHCHLFYEVSWQSVPPSDKPYRVVLSNLTSGYDLNPANSNLSIPLNSGGAIVHHFPKHLENTHQVTQHVDLFRHKLNGEFITLRYRDNRIPTIQIFSNGNSITMPIDLTKAFREWGWSPDRTPEQIYKIKIVIMDDGRVILTPLAYGTVLDWEPGGNIVQ